jgi:hypothetical protein
MMRRALVLVLVAACALAGASLAGGCSQQPIMPCRDIPEGGCPVQGGTACQDPTCVAAYACEADGGWTLVRACPATDGGPPDAGADAPGPSDAGYDIDAPPGAFGGPGCLDLQPPDCPLGTALVCPNACCGCTDLYVCDDGGWDPWGVCTDDAGVTKL